MSTSLPFLDITVSRVSIPVSPSSSPRYSHFAGGSCLIRSQRLLAICQRNNLPITRSHQSKQRNEGILAHQPAGSPTNNPGNLTPELAMTETAPDKVRSTTDNEPDPSIEVKAATVLQTSNSRLRNLVNDLCSFVHVQPPPFPDLENWSRVCEAMRQQTSLQSILSPSLTEFRKYEDVRPVRAAGTNYSPEDATLEETFAHAFHVINHLEQHQCTGALPTEDIPIPHLEWYSTRHRMVAALLRWVDTEAAPIICALVEAEGRVHPHPAFAILEIPQLQQRLRDVEEAYAAEVTRARTQDTTAAAESAEHA